MYLRKDKLRELMLEKANGNYHELARLLGVNVAQLYRILNSNGQAGPKFLGKLMAFCRREGLDFEHYIFLPKALTGVNGPAEPTGMETKAERQAGTGTDG